MMLGCKRLKVKSSAPVPLAIFPYAFRVIIEGAVEGTSGFQETKLECQIY